MAKGKRKIFDDIDEWFNGTRKTTAKSSGSAGGATIKKSRPAPAPAQAAKNIINGVKSANTKTNKRLPQVIVKISGSSKGADKAAAHLAYTSRDGKVELEDESGRCYIGEEHKHLIKSWQAAGFHDKHDTGTKREAFHFVFSMPAGTDPKSLKDAVRNLVQEEFAGHKYFMAQHLDTDKPHCHVLVCATDDRGARLNPRKQDLHNYRVAFVNKLAEQGIEATASRKSSRFQKKGSEKQWKIHKAERTGQSLTKKSSTAAQQKKQKLINRSIITAYDRYAKQLPQGAVKQTIQTVIKETTQDKER